MEQRDMVSLSVEIAQIHESVKSAHRRIDENDRITEGIHKLAASVETLTMQVKMLAESMDEHIKRLENGQKAQGERIGALEAKPAKRWEGVVGQVISLVVAAAVGVMLAKVGL